MLNPFLPTHRSLSTLLTALLLICLLGACRSDGVGGQRPRPSPFGTWTLVWLEDDDLEASEAAGGRRPELTLNADGTLSGHGGINSLRATFEARALVEGRFEHSPLISTLMGGPPGVMELERRFLRAVDDANQARVEADELHLLRDGMPQARFERAPDKRPGETPSAEDSE